MTSGNTPPKVQVDPVSDTRDQRAQPRLSLILRAAKLIGPSGEFLCIVRDISESGVRLRLFHPIVDQADLSLEIVAGQRFGIEKVWENSDEAGFRFTNTIDVQLFLNGKGPFPKRSVRLHLLYPARLGYLDRTAAAVIHDLSREGARIETAEHLAIAQAIRLESDHLPALEATVRWRRQPYYGLVFRQVMSMEELAQCVQKVQLLKSGDS